MKAKKIELDVDFIGIQESTLTIAEETAKSEFIRSRKAEFGSGKGAKQKVKAG